MRTPKEIGQWLFKIIVEAFIIGIIVSLISSALWAYYDSFSSSADFVKNLKGEISYNIQILGSLQTLANSAGEKRIPFYRNQIKTSVRDSFWYVHKNQFSSEEITKIENYYTNIEYLRESVERIWIAGSSGQQELAKNLLDGATKLQISLIAEGDELQSILKKNSLIRPRLCVSKYCVLRP
ncbi:MAG: hypothetical protein HYV42_03120 [Candidatus Magasanikbacteria bacterium]|nr:hypothetical protein [Candidatus Magasanikbacteria bacterium]